MASQTWTHRYFIHAPVKVVYDHLADPHNYIGLSPLVVKVSDIFPTDEGVAYTSVERFKFFGIIPYDNHIKVMTTFTQRNEKLTSEVDSPFRVRVRFIFDFQAENGGTWLTETVNAQMPSLVEGFVVQQAKSVQQIRAEVLKTRLEI